MHVAQAYASELSLLVPGCTGFVPSDGAPSVLELGSSARRSVTALECELRSLTLAAPLFGTFKKAPHKRLVAELPLEVSPSTYVVHGKRRVSMMRLRLARIMPLQTSKGTAALRTCRGELIVQQDKLLLNGVQCSGDDDPSVLPELEADERERVLAYARSPRASLRSRDCSTSRRVVTADDNVLSLLRSALRMGAHRATRGARQWPALFVSRTIERALATGQWPGVLSGAAFTHAQVQSNGVARAAQLRMLVARDVRCCNAARQVDAHALGALCPVDTPEGHMVGLTKHLASGCRVSHASSLAQLRTLVAEHGGQDRAFFNGVPALTRVDGPALAARLRAARGSTDVGVAWHVEARELWVWGDAGRMLVSVGAGGHVDVAELSASGTAVPRQVLSVCASTIPFAAHNQPARATFQCAQAKQALGSAVLDRQALLPNQRSLWYAQEPLVRCERSTPGLNVTLCICTYQGFNQEDAIVMSRAAVQRGLFRSSALACAVNPRNAGADDVDGVPAPGTRLPSGARADACFLGVDANNEPLRVVRERRMCVPQVGDKFTSRHGQKGVCALLAEEADMPFELSTGVVPDVLFNPHGMPSRMTVGQVLEACFGKLAAARGAPHRTRALERASAPALAAALHDMGFARSGGARMLCGKTGQPIESVLLTGCVFMQALPHFSADKCYARGRFGATDAATGQPLGGRAHGGGLRVGEMEKNTLLAHGADRTLHDRFVNSSDATRVDVCRACGRANERDARSGLCVACGSAAFAEGVSLTRPMQTFTHHLAACGVQVSFEC